MCEFGFRWQRNFESYNSKFCIQYDVFRNIVLTLDMNLFISWQFVLIFRPLYESHVPYKLRVPFLIIDFVWLFLLLPYSESDKKSKTLVCLIPRGHSLNRLIIFWRLFNYLFFSKHQYATKIFFLLIIPKSQ